MRRAYFLSTLICLSLALASCHHSPTALKRYPFTGRIVLLTPASQTATIDGDAVAGFMDAMTMPYKVKDAAAFKQLSTGDRISADVVVAQSNDAAPGYWLENVRVTGHVTEPPAKSADAVHIPAPGDLVPDFAFTNQDGRRTSLAQYRGQTLIVTFIYTRCPFADYCPRVSHEFADAYRQIINNPADKHIHLLSISFDPAHDTPQVLHDYAFSLAGAKDPAMFHRWEFATAAPDDLPKLARYFGFAYKEENNQITHSLSTTVIGPDGKIISWRHDSDWHAADLLQDASSR